MYVCLVYVYVRTHIVLKQQHTFVASIVTLHKSCTPGNAFIIISPARRFVDNPTLFQSWVEAAKSLPSTSVAIGGNAPVMAHRLALEGWSVLLGSIMKEDTRCMLHPSIQVAAGNGSYADRDDVHLLFEYDIGSQWGEYVTPRANRYIVHSDKSNMMLDSLDGFVTSLADFDPTLMIVGGLQMLDNSPYDPDIRTSKLKQLSRVLAGLPNTTRVHFEMASFTEYRLMSELVQYVVPYADSLGMNEQELANLCHFIESGNITTVTDPYPRVATTLDQTRRLMNLLSRQRPRDGRSLSRVHVHTLAFQALVITKQSDWRSMHAAIAKASLTANRHVCKSSRISTINARLIMDDSFSVSQEPNAHRMPFIDSAPISCWNEALGRICVAPNLVCTKVLQTGGGGDNVSAAGLALQL